jgi:hypothetical protein
MKRHRLPAVTALICGLFFAGGTARGQEKPDDAGKSAPAEMQIPKPGPEMAKLNFLIGSWTMTAEYVKSPMMPDGQKQTGWYKVQEGPGGFSVLVDFEADGTKWKEIGHEVMTWSPKKNTYSVITVGNGFPDFVEGAGHWEGANLVIEQSFDMGTRTVHTRAVYYNPTDTKVHIEEFVQGEDGSWNLIWRCDATK